MLYPVKNETSGIGVLQATLDDSIGVTSMYRRRSVHFRGVTWPSHRRGMGVEWAWTPIPRPWTKWMGRQFIDGCLRFSIKINRCTVLMTSHITWHHQYSATVYLKIKVCMEWVSEFKALHFNTLHYHYSTPLHCTTTTTLHCTHFTALCSLHCTTTIHCTVLSTLHHHYSTALYSLHCMLRSSFN